MFSTSLFYRCVLKELLKMPNRAKAQQTIIDNIEKLAGASNAQLYKTKFSQMSDDEFHQFMLDIVLG